MIWKNSTHVFQTIGVPPRIGRTLFATIGSTMNISSELRNSVVANARTRAVRPRCGKFGDRITGLSRGCPDWRTEALRGWPEAKGRPRAGSHFRLAIVDCRFTDCRLAIGDWSPTDNATPSHQSPIDNTPIANRQSAMRQSTIRNRQFLNHQSPTGNRQLASAFFCEGLKRDVVDQRA